MRNAELLPTTLPFLKEYQAWDDEYCSRQAVRD
jgi:hypothetical protein